MTLKPQDPKDLAELIKKTFCNLTTIHSCSYINEPFCEGTCNYYKEKINELKYAGWRK